MTFMYKQNLQIGLFAVVIAKKILQSFSSLKVEKFKVFFIVYTLIFVFVFIISFELWK